MRSRQLRVLSCVALLALAACGDPNAGVDAGATAPQSSDAANSLPAKTPEADVETTVPPLTEPAISDTAGGAGGAIEAPSASSNPIFELIDAGAEPRQTLRYRLDAGATTDLDSDLIQDFDINLDGASQVSTNTIHQAFRYTVIAPGQISVEVTDMSIDSTAAEIGTMGLEDMKMSMTVDDRGIVSSLTSNVDEIITGLPPQMEQLLVGLPESMKALSFAFPEEAVGVGATWQITSDTVSGGIPLTTVQRYTVTAITSDQVSLTSEVELSLGEGEIKIPGIPAGSLDGLEMGGGGSGTLVVSLTRPFANDSVSEVSTASSFSMGTSSMTQSIVQKITTTVK
jgi:hypothetical protein